MSLTQDDQDAIERALRGLVGGPPSDAPDQDFMNDPRALAGAPPDMDLRDDRGLADAQSEQALNSAIERTAPTASHFGQDDPGLDLLHDPGLARDYLDQKLRLTPEHDFDFTKDPSVMNRGAPTPMSQGDFIDPEPVRNNPAAQMAALAAEKTLPFTAPSNPGQPGDFIDALKAGPDAPSPQAYDQTPPEPAPAERPLAPQQRLPDADPGVQATRTLPPPTPSQTAAPEAALSKPPTVDSTSPVVPPDPAATKDSPPLPVTQPTPLQPDAIQAKEPALMAGDKGPAQAAGYTPDAIRGLTGRDFHSGLGERPNVNPLAFLAAAMSGTPGPAMAGVMQQAAQQGSQWDQRQRQAALDEDASALHAAQARKLAMESDPGIIQKKLDIQLGNLGYRGQGLALQQDKWAQSNSPFSAHEMTAVERARRAAAARTHATNVTNNEDKSVKADTARVVSEAAGAGQRTGQIQTDLQYAPQVNANAATKAAGETTARGNAEYNTPGARDARTLKDTQELRAQSDKYQAETKFDVGAAHTMDSIDRILADYPADASGNRNVPGVGVGSGLVKDWMRDVAKTWGADPKRQNDAIELNNARATLAEMAQRKESGAAGPEAEKLRYMIRVGADPDATTTAFFTALDAAKKLTRMNLNFYAAGNERGAAASLKAAGLDSWFDQPQSAAPSGGGGGMDTMPKPVSGAFNAGGTPTYNVRKGGKTAAQVQLFIDNGFDVEPVRSEP
jgi:hypothetical protein